MVSSILYPDAHLFAPEDEDFERAATAGYTLVPIAGRDPSLLAVHASGAVGCLAWGGTWNAAVFDALPGLRVLSRCGAGYDSIDRNAARERGITVTYVPGASDDEVAEHTIGLIFDLARKITDSDRMIRRARWASSTALAPMRRIRGSVLGLVGYGRIAQAVAGRALALGMAVQAFDPFANDEKFDRSGVARVLKFDALLSESDFVSLHLPAVPGRAAVIGATELGRMRRTACLVNTARGSLVDTDALVAALLSGSISGAGLDVLDVEPIPPGHPLLGLQGVVLTPHSAAFSVPALCELRTRAIDNVIAALTGGTPHSLIPEED